MGVTVMVNCDGVSNTELLEAGVVQCLVRQWGC